MIKRSALLAMMLLAACLLAAQSVAAQGQGGTRRAAQTTPQSPQQQTTETTQAQQASQQQQAQEPGKDVSPETADLAITANVTASELRFETVPNPQVEFTGQPRRETQWDALRENLPRPVQPGVTYRNIGIRLKIVSVFADIDRIVAEALGEVPIQDQLPPEKDATESASPQNETPASSPPLNNPGQNISPPPVQSSPKLAPVPGPPSRQTGARP